MAESELKLCVSNEEREAKKLETVKVELEKLENSIAEKLEILEELKHKVPISEKTVKTAKQQLNSINTELVQVTANVHRNAASLEEARSSMQASRSRNRTVEALMNEKTKGRCPGFFGRLVSKPKLFVLNKYINV